MFYAIKKNGEKISSFCAIKDEKYYCPACLEQLILKSGKTNMKHFAHKSLKDCDEFISDMSEWHIKWQEKFPIENREVVIKNKIGDNELIHRADVCIGNYIIEFQHSKITKEEFNKRNNFYAQTGYKVIWIFDFREEYENG